MSKAVIVHSLCILSGGYTTGLDSVAVILCCVCADVTVPQWLLPSICCISSRVGEAASVIFCVVFVSSMSVFRDNSSCTADVFQFHFAPKLEVVFDNIPGAEHCGNLRTVFY